MMPYSRRTTAATTLLLLVFLGFEATAQEGADQLGQCAEGFTAFLDVPLVERRERLINACAGLLPAACEGYFAEMVETPTVCWREICSSLRSPTDFLCVNPEEPGLFNQRLDLFLTYFEQEVAIEPLPGWVQEDLMRAFMGNSAEDTQRRLAEVMADIAASDLSSEQRQLVVSAFIIGVIIPMAEIQAPIEGLEPVMSPIETAARTITVSVTPEGIWVASELVVPLEDGVLSDSHRATSDSPILPALQQHLELLVEGFDTEGVSVELEIDTDTSYSVLTAVMMTVSNAGITRFDFSNRDSSADEPGEVHEQAPLPRILISVSSQGLTLSDMRDTELFSASGFGLPGPLCAHLPPGEILTFCATPRAEGESLVDALPWNELYNRLVAIRAHPAWRDQWGLDNLLINVLAAEDTPYEVVIRIMDVARHYLEQDYYPTVEALDAAPQRLIEGEPALLFPSPVLLLPR